MSTKVCTSFQDFPGAFATWGHHESPVPARDRLAACRIDRKVGRTFSGGCLSRLVAGVVAAILSLTGTANAYSITGTSVAAGLTAYLGPNGTGDPIGSGDVVDSIPNNSTVYIDCYWGGVPETGPWGPTWVYDALEGYSTPSGSYHDLRGYPDLVFVSDAWVNTGGDTSRLVTPCYGY